MMDIVTDLVADALRQARLVRKCLDAKGIPLLDPRHRTFATDISRRLARRDIVNQAFLLDLEAFLAVISEAIEDGTTVIWRGHEHDPDCGYTMPVRSDDANALLFIQDEVIDLVTSIEGALDGAKAYAIAKQVFRGLIHAAHLWMRRLDGAVLPIVGLDHRQCARRPPSFCC